MVMKLTSSLEETTVQGIDIKCSYWLLSYDCAFATSARPKVHFDILDGLKYHR